MQLIEIPFRPDKLHGWEIPVPGEHSRHFASREEALAFALSLARQRRANRVEPSYLCVEGGDGQWRLFTPDLTPPK